METDPPPSNPCYPSPCGPNSQCRDIGGQAICSCLIGYFGSPPSCRPECTTSTDCLQNMACVNQRCVDPCPGACGINAVCQVINHNPICSCPPNYSGDPFIRCQVVVGMLNGKNSSKSLSRCTIFLVETRPNPVVVPTEDPCVPNPCGLNSICERTPGGRYQCSCVAGYLGSPPFCRPECLQNDECSRELACINMKCRDPCPGSCGLNTRCVVVNHVPNCACLDGFVGDPFRSCYPKPSKVFVYIINILLILKDKILSKFFLQNLLYNI